MLLNYEVITKAWLGMQLLKQGLDWGNLNRIINTAHDFKHTLYVHIM